MTSPGRTRPRAIDFHAHVIVPEVYAVAAEHNIFFGLPTDPGVTDEMRRSIKGRAAAVLARMTDVAERIGNMDAMGVDIQVLSASLVHQGLEWADAQTSLQLARATNDWIAKAVASHPTRLLGLGTLPLHVPALAVTELERCMGELWLKGAAISTMAGPMELGDPEGARRARLHPSRRQSRPPLQTVSSLEQRRAGVRGSDGDLVIDV